MTVILSIAQYVIPSTIAASTDTRDSSRLQRKTKDKPLFSEKNHINRQKRATSFRHNYRSSTSTRVLTPPVPPTFLPSTLSKRYGFYLLFWPQSRLRVSYDTRSLFISECHHLVYCIIHFLLIIRYRHNYSSPPFSLSRWQLFRGAVRARVLFLHRSCDRSKHKHQHQCKGPVMTRSANAINHTCPRDSHVATSTVLAAPSACVHAYLRVRVCIRVHVRPRVRALVLACA